jgi:anaerobic magnesium-protoporphyrin IX monomethyl ester cyclase
MYKKVLMIYPNLPLMMAPAISVGIFTAICKKHNVEFKIFETTQYSDEYNNRHIRMTEIGAARPNSDDEIKDMFLIKPRNEIIPDLIRTVKDYKPDLILMSIQEDVWREGLILLDAIKDYNIPHVIGGVFPTMASDIVIAHPLIKNIVKGEGEHVLTDILNGTPIHKTDGIIWKDDDGNIHKNKPQTLCDISAVRPDYSCFENNRWQRPMGGKVFKRALSLETYRGCPYNCTYCNSPAMRTFSTKNLGGNFMRRKTADIVENDLLHYIENIDPDLIMFMDDSFLARPKKEIFALCEMLSKYKIPFWFNTRIENCTPDVLEALKHAGVYRMAFGLESGNEEYRSKVLQRPVKNDVYRKHFEYINDSNIPYSLNVIIGMPLETRAMVLETAALVHDSLGYDGLTISSFQPYYGTPLRELALKHGFLSPDYINGGSLVGYLDHRPVIMPAPYLQPKDVELLCKTFSLYAFFDKSRWPEINKAETDNVLYKKLMSEYHSIFYGDSQQGGKDKIGNYCAKHDASATYEFSEAV